LSNWHLQATEPLAWLGHLVRAGEETEVSQFTITPAFSDDQLEAAYDAVLAEMQALPPGQLLPIYVDPLGAATKAAHCSGKVHAIRSLIVRQLPEFDVDRLDKLQDYALALIYSHTRHLAGVQSSPKKSEPPYKAAVAMRELLLCDAQTLANRNLLNREPLRELKGARGYKNLAADLQTLVVLLRGSWPAIQGKCAVKKADLARANSLASRLIDSVGLRGHVPTKVKRTADARVRAFTLLVHCYNDLRRAVVYLRGHHGDADIIVPPLTGGRVRGRKGGITEEAEQGLFASGNKGYASLHARR
jgi:hypothetical protein